MKIDELELIILSTFIQSRKKYFSTCKQLEDTEHQCEYFYCPHLTS